MFFADPDATTVAKLKSVALSSSINSSILIYNLTSDAVVFSLQFKMDHIMLTEDELSVTVAQKSVTCRTAGAISMFIGKRTLFYYCLHSVTPCSISPWTTSSPFFCFSI